MPRKETICLVLRARIALERLRNGEADRYMIDLNWRVTLIANFVTEAAHGSLDIADLDAGRHGPEDIVIERITSGRAMPVKRE
jgi:hypothetical protein